MAWTERVTNEKVLDKIKSIIDRYGKIFHPERQDIRTHIKT